MGLVWTRLSQCWDQERSTTRGVVPTFPVGRVLVRPLDDGPDVGLNLFSHTTAVKK